MGKGPCALGSCSRYRIAVFNPAALIPAMIPITLSWFVCFYLGLFLAAVSILWIGYEILRKRHANSISRVRVFCRICGSRYTDGTSGDLMRCPVCDSLNERSSTGGF